MITATRRTPTISSTSGQSSADTTSTITGSAVELSRGEEDAYRELNLLRSEAPLLLFSPTTYGDKVEVGDTLTWPETNGTEYTVRSARHLKPDGVVIASYLVVGK